MGIHPMSKAPEPVEPVVVHRWGIIGPYGNIWTPDTFAKPEDAEDHLRSFWGRQGFDGYYAAPVEVTVRDITTGDTPRVKLIARALSRAGANR